MQLNNEPLSRRYPQTSLVYMRCDVAESNGGPIGPINSDSSDAHNALHLPVRMRVLMVGRALLCVLS